MYEFLQKWIQKPSFIFDVFIMIYKDQLTSFRTIEKQGSYQFSASICSISKNNNYFKNDAKVRQIWFIVKSI